MSAFSYHRPQTTNRTPSSKQTEWLILAVILLVAAFLRLYQLDSIPPGFTHDEAAHGQDALAILHGARPVYETVGYGREPLYDYATALTMALVNRTDYVAVRLTSALFGLLTVAATYLLIRRMFDMPTALITAAMLAVSFWAIATSRQALRSVMLPALLGFAMYFWQRGISHLQSPTSNTQYLILNLYFALAGLFLAATLWTYMAARATWILFIIAPALVFLFDRDRFRQHWPGMILALLVAGLLAASMFLWLQAHPGAEQRLGQLGEPLRLLATGHPSEIIKNSLEALGMFTFRADTLWLYNIPGKPWLDPVTGLLFYIGILIALWNWRKPAYLLSLAWLAVGTFPSLMTGLVASGTRAVAVQPVLYLFPALALVELGKIIKGFPFLSLGHGFSRIHTDMNKKIRESGNSLIRTLYLCVLAVLIAVTGTLSFRDYFITWVNTRDVRVAYHTTLLEMARYLNAQPSGGTVALSSITPGRFHDPYSMGMLLHRRDLALRWFDGRNALALPPAGSRLIVQAISPIDPALAPFITQDARLLESRSLRSDDLNPRFDVFDWQGASNIILLKPEGPADLGHTIELIGCSVNTATIKPTDELTVLTFWRVRSTTDPDRETVLFTHLLATSSGPLVSGQDLIGYPSWQWQPGDEFIQVHRFLIPSGTPSGQYPLEIGAYTREIPSAVQPNPPTMRLTVYNGDKAAGDRVLLPPVAVIGNQ